MLLSGLVGLGGSEEDRCLPTVSKGFQLPTPENTTYICCMLEIITFLLIKHIQHTACVCTVGMRVIQMLTQDWVAWRELRYGDSEYVRGRRTEIHHGAVGLVTHHAGDEASLLFPDSVDHIPCQCSHVGLDRGVAWEEAAHRPLLSLLRDWLRRISRKYSDTAHACFI